jgi:hypothetical protein
LRARAEGVDLRVEHLAITPEQIAAWDLPTREIKRSDSGAESFESRFGPISAELDTIPPKQLRALVDGAIWR